MLSANEIAMRVRRRPGESKRTGSPRDTVMISHANPEDNEFTLWLALQLAKKGYKVWTDLTDLLGGESFWNDIEQVIWNRAVKFVYVLSRTSNESNRGFRKELHLADSEGKKLAATLPRVDAHSSVSAASICEAACWMYIRLSVRSCASPFHS